MSAPSSPGALGVYEAAVVGALQLFGVDASVALAMAITTHLLQYAITGVLGVYGLITMLNPEVAQAFAMRKQGHSKADIDQAFG